MEINSDAASAGNETKSVAHQVSVLMPDERRATLDDLREGLYAELDPETPYQRFLVEDLATVTWEAIRYRKFRDCLIVAEFRDLAIGLLATGTLEKACPFDPIGDARKLVDGLSSNDPQLIETTAKLLSVKGYSREVIMARAAERALPKLAIYDKQIGSLESRRRQLYKEYRKLRLAQNAA